MSNGPSAIKRRNRHKRKVMGYDPDPPRCATCVDLVPAMHAVPGQAAYRPPHCNAMGFPVDTHGVCDHWRGKNGDVLENRPGAPEATS